MIFFGFFKSLVGFEKKANKYVNFLKFMLKSYTHVPFFKKRICRPSKNSMSNFDLVRSWQVIIHKVIRGMGILLRRLKTISRIRLLTKLEPRFNQADL